tara:strand:+ start:195 stop:359 length:165 start_codon:yes stop_codon:yes gene_type:complete
MIQVYDKEPLAAEKKLRKLLNEYGPFKLEEYLRSGFIHFPNDFDLQKTNSFHGL